LTTGYFLHEKQQKALDDIEKYPVSAYLGGIRSGKTIVGCHFVLWMLSKRPDELGAIFANTTKQLTKSTLKEFKAVLHAYDMREGFEYVVNKNPKNVFGYDSKFTDHDGIWSFCNGAQLFTFSLETQIRGIELGWVFGDEIQNATKDELDVVLGRMSGSQNPKTFYALTPPKDNPEVDEMIYGENAIPVTIGTTYDNSANLPDGYIEMLKSTMDALTFAREVMCERKPMSGLNWLYTFNKEKNVSDRAVYQKNQIVYLSFDFNNNPFVCILAHKGTLAGKQFGYMHIFAEVEINPDAVGGSTYIATIVQAIKLRIPYQFDNKLMIVTGDASGRAQSITNRVGENIWTELMKGLGITQRSLIVSAKNPLLKDSRELCVSVVANYDEFLINPECKSLIRDCEFVKANDDSTIKKDNRKNIIQRADFMDTLRYLINAFIPDFLKR